MGTSRNPYSTDWTKPAVGGFTITPGVGELTKPTRAIYVGGSGDVTCTMDDGTSIQFVGLAAGVFHPIACTHVTAATATSILGLY